jgi:preprotein translocase subunit Sec63
MSARSRIRLRKYAGNLAFEFFVVLLGVLLALFIDTWWQDQRDKKLVETVLHDIRLEHQHNLVLLTEFLKKHQMVYDTTVVYLNDPSVSVWDVIQRATKGLQTTSVSSVSWNAFSNGKLTAMPFNQIRSLSNCETECAVVNEQVKRVVDHLYQYNDDTSNKAKRLFSLLMYDLIDAEREAAEALSNYLDENQENPKKK